tara:strand:- start:1058 stop:1192 length:135 start_codon:yes stop_codon:yes gene_type:complete
VSPECGEGVHGEMDFLKTIMLARYQSQIPEQLVQQIKRELSLYS